MAWHEDTLNNWAELVEIATAFANWSVGRPAHICRGQADARWPLKSSLCRLLPSSTSQTQALRIEREALEEFERYAHLHVPVSWLPPSPSDAPSFFDWWALMQHYSAPTRLLDWTASLYVATYFAVSSHEQQDGAVYTTHCFSLDEGMEKLCGGKTCSISVDDLSSEPPLARICTIRPRKATERIWAQQGYFTIPYGIVCDQGELIDQAITSVVGENDVAHRKLVIPARLKRDFLVQLRYLNITPQSLFPGIDGLGRAVADTVRLGS